MDYTNKDRRVELISINDEFTKLKPGSKGTYIAFDSINHCIRWDNGSTLSLIPNTDKFKFI